LLQKENVGPAGDILMIAVPCRDGLRLGLRVRWFLNCGRSWMARQKNPTALFDVIHSAKKPPKASPSASIPTPKWWGKGKKLPTTPVVESTENVGKQKSWLTRARENGVTPAALPVVPEAVVRQAPEEFSAPVDDLPANDSQADTEILPAVAPTVSTERKPRFIDRFVSRAPKSEPIVEEFAAEPALPQVTDDEPVAEIKPDVRRSREVREPAMRIDSAGGDIRFRLSYAAVIAVGFIFAIALAIAFIAGQRSASSQTAFDDDSLAGKTPTTAPTYGMTMAVGPESPADAADKSAIRPDVLTLPQHPSRPAVTITPDNPPHALLPINKKTRTIGMIYVIVQSYAEKDLAQKACDFMNAQGVECTLVQGPSHWALPDWSSVVGLQPFNKRDPALSDYEKSVRALGTKFTSRIIDQFQPQGYTWRADSDLSQQ
jgi:hypothetical protein